MALETSYGSSPSGAGGFAPAGGQAQAGGEYWDLGKLRKCLTEYLFNKRAEAEEQGNARRYYHGSQYSQEQVKVMTRRKQPVMTFNKIAEKVNGAVGVIEKLRQDPKAYARTPQHEEGADLATAALNYVLDEQQWPYKSPQVAMDGAVDGVGGIMLEIEQGDQGDPEIGFETVDIQSFFYDPRSYKADFSDARYMGIQKWLDQEVAQEMYPDAPENAFSAADDIVANSENREARWFQSDGVARRVRIVDIWYQTKGGWCWCQFSGNAKLMEGKSYLKDEKGKDYSKFIMFSGNVDQDGDRYSFFRNMKSAQDGINAKQSKMQHLLASKRLFIREGGVNDVEKVRAEYAKPDGVIMTPGPPKEAVMADDQSFDFAGWTKMLELNLNEIENFGPNPQLVGELGANSQSGRAIALLQQAGMAKLGPYILSYRGWKVRVYRAIWNAIQAHWKAERWIRVTDDQQLAQYIQINGMQVDPMTGMPSMVNPIGSLDVDIILDEGPDHVNAMADLYETLQNVLPSVAPLLSPQLAQSVVGMLIESSPLPADKKKQFKDQQEQAAQQPPPPDPQIEALKAKTEMEAQSKQQDFQLAQAKAQADIQTSQVQSQNDLQMKQAELEMNLRAKQQEMDMAWQEHQAEMAREAERCDMQMQHENNKANLNLQHEKAKSEITVGTQKSTADIKKRQMLAIADPEAANDLDNMDTFKELMAGFEKGMAEIAKSITEVAKEPEKPETKTIKVQRDKAGRITGAVLQEA